MGSNVFWECPNLEKLCLPLSQEWNFYKDYSSKKCLITKILSKEQKKEIVEYEAKHSPPEPTIPMVDQYLYDLSHQENPMVNDLTNKSSSSENSSD